MNLQAFWPTSSFLLTPISKQWGWLPAGIGFSGAWPQKELPSPCQPHCLLTLSLYLLVSLEFGELILQVAGPGFLLPLVFCLSPISQASEQS